MNRLEKLSAIIMGLFGIGLVLNVFIELKSGSVRPL
mgnify:CR=1